jgi:hypothetical protein
MEGFTLADKNVYFYKVVLTDNTTGDEVTPERFKALFSDIIARVAINNSIDCTGSNPEPVMLDVLEDTDEYLFARLNRKRPNNSMQKRDYATRTTTDVLAPDEAANSGIECFTYCILGYRHGILSIANVKGAPGYDALAMMFALHKPQYQLDADGIPNNDLVSELASGRTPEINRIHIDIAQPDAQILERVFGFCDEGILNEMRGRTSSIVIDVKPSFRGKLIDDPSVIARVINAFRQNQDQFNSVKLTGKVDGRNRQREYDLYEEYFKYPIDIKEYRTEGGRKIEVSKSTIQNDYKDKMTKVYDQYKEMLLVFVDRS